jgi:hypothetical protein
MGIVAMQAAVLGAELRIERETRALFRFRSLKKLAKIPAAPMRDVALGGWHSPCYAFGAQIPSWLGQPSNLH